MLTTIEAEIDVNGTVHLLEPIHVTKLTRALVTVLEDATAPITAKGNVADMLSFLRANRLPAEARRNAEEIDAQIEEERNSWE